MDVTDEIKAKLPIEDLVGRYCQVVKKGKQLKCLCPFHNDKNPSLLISPEKGIAYCFACNNGGDIFTFYQKIEGVEFRQALKDLADMAGVEVPDLPQEPKVKKDVKERMRNCLEETIKIYQAQLKKSEVAMKYINDRNLTVDDLKTFQIGYSPDSFTATYEQLLKKDYSRSEIVGAGLGVQKDLKDQKIYDRFRNRLMFPIHDHQGKVVGFGGRTLGDDDAKYINSSEGPLYNKSQVLYGYHLARDAMRDSKTAIMVEGYFDVIACHRVGVKNVVAVSGTALTENHVKMLKRLVDTVVLCLDQDTAGKAAAERSFLLCSEAGLAVNAINLADKDPDEALAADPDGFKKELESGGVPYIESLLNEVDSTELSSTAAKRKLANHFLPLIKAVPTAVERSVYLGKLAGLLGTTETTLKDDLARLPKNQPATPTPATPAVNTGGKSPEFTTLEVVLALLCHYSTELEVLDKLIKPGSDFGKTLYEALKASPEEFTIEGLDLPADILERLKIVLLYCEESNLLGWSASTARREIVKNIKVANKQRIRERQQELAKKLLKAQVDGDQEKIAKITQQYQEVLKLAKP